MPGPQSLVTFVLTIKSTYNHVIISELANLLSNLSYPGWSSCHGRICVIKKSFRHQKCPKLFTKHNSDLWHRRLFTLKTEEVVKIMTTRLKSLVINFTTNTSHNPLSLSLPLPSLFLSHFPFSLSLSSSLSLFSCSLSLPSLFSPLLSRYSLSLSSLLSKQRVGCMRLKVPPHDEAWSVRNSTVCSEICSGRGPFCGSTEF